VLTHLREVLLCHGANGKIPASQVVTILKIESTSGELWTVTVDGGTVMINDATLKVLTTVTVDSGTVMINDATLKVLTTLHTMVQSTPSPQF
jgi:hypothetical protein